MNLRPELATEDHIVREAVTIAEAGGWTPAQVAFAWLHSRPGTIIPILGATSEQQLTCNLASLDVTLDDVLRRLDEISAPQLGFPHDVTSGEDMIGLTYGDQWRQVSAHGRASRRPVNDNDTLA